MRKSRLTILIFSLTLSLFIFSGCGKSGGSGGNGNGTILKVTVAPKVVALMPEGTVQFDATVTKTGSISTDVTWSVITPNGGTIDPDTGFYQAPDDPGVYYIKATSVADPAKSDQAKVIVGGGGAKQYKGEIFIKNTGTGTAPNGEIITINQQASFKVTIPEVDPEAEKPLVLILHVDEVTASIEDSHALDDDSWTIEGSVSSAKMDWYIRLEIKEDTYDLWVGTNLVPCLWTFDDGSTNQMDGQFMGKYIANYELPVDPSRLTGSISEKMYYYTFVDQEVTWDLETSL